MKTKDIEQENINETERENAMLSQARQVLQFMQTDLWTLFKNTWQVTSKLTKLERQRAMKLQSSRENCLYFTGVEDGIEKAIEAIEKIVADGRAIESKRELLEEREDM